MKLKHVILVCLFALATGFWHTTRPVTHEGKGPVARAQPAQSPTRVPPFRYLDEYTVRPLADFDITARVLSRRRYRLDRAAKVSPVDLALGWGPMSDDHVLSHLKISQSGRWFHWRYKTLPIPMEQIQQHAANMHLVPADRKIARAIQSARPGDVVRFSGHLVRMHGQDGWFWQSSLTRTDAGQGACEVVFVRTFQVVTGDS